MFEAFLLLAARPGPFHFRLQPSPFAHPRHRADTTVHASPLHRSICVLDMPLPLGGRPALTIDLDWPKYIVVHIPGHQ